ncbi:dihydroorotate oxidase [Periweissella fabaria]|nr:dihydroorotate oxidase [Periweissella fabaria]
MMAIDFKTTMANAEFPSIFLNASGVNCMTVTEMDEMINAACTGGVVTKSATPQQREGNPQPRYYQLEHGSINSMGLPNEGFPYYLDYVTKEHAKPTILSVAGLKMSDNIELLHKIQASDYTGLTELNLSCPNVIGKPQVAYDFEETDALLAEIFSFYTKPLGVKLPPYFDLVHFDQMATILNKYPLTHINTVNSVGNGLWIDIDTEKVVIKPKQGFGGLGGTMILPTALANVRAFRQRLNPSIKIIGTGGVTSGADVFMHLLCGADMVSVGTALLHEGVGIFQRLTDELTTIMAEKGYTSIEDFRGKVQDF